MNKIEATAASLEELAQRVWPLLTNIKLCGGASNEGRRVVQRRLRQAGWRFYLRTFTKDSGDGYPIRWNEWGTLAPGQSLQHDEFVVEEVVGVSLSHCAHKLGSGNANEGWRMYHNW